MKASNPASVLNGTYRFTITRQDAEAFYRARNRSLPPQVERLAFPSTITITLRDGTAALRFSEQREVVIGSYTVDGNRLTITDSENISAPVTFTVDGHGNIQTAPIPGTAYYPGDDFRLTVKPWTKIG